MTEKDGKKCDFCSDRKKPEQFEIDESNSVDKSGELKINETGYKSVHYILKLGSSRRDLPEWETYKDCVVEIQVRTLLQHVWASMSHDNLYKFSEVLPTEINRRFYLTAGMLELLDIEFQRLSDELNDYRSKVSEDTKKGNLDDIEINSTSLVEYLNKRYDNFDNWSGFNRSFITLSDVIIQELKIFGISSIGDLDKIMPRSFDEEEYRNRKNNYIGLLRHVMIIADAARYFGNCYNGWGLKRSSFNFLNNLIKNFNDILLKYDVPVRSYD